MIKKFRQNLFSFDFNVKYPKLYIGFRYFVINLFWISIISHAIAFVAIKVYMHEIPLPANFSIKEYFYAEFNKKEIFFIGFIIYVLTSIFSLVTFACLLWEKRTKQNRKLVTFFKRANLFSASSLGIVLGLLVMGFSYEKFGPILGLETKTIDSIESQLIRDGDSIDTAINNLDFDTLRMYSEIENKAPTFSEKMNTDPLFFNELANKRNENIKNKKLKGYQIRDWDLTRDGNIQGGIVPKRDEELQIRLNEPNLIVAYFKKSNFSDSKDFLVSNLESNFGNSNCYIINYKITYKNGSPDQDKTREKDNCTNRHDVNYSGTLSPLRILVTDSEEFNVESVEAWITPNVNNGNPEKEFNLIKSIRVIEGAPQEIFYINNLCLGIKHSGLDGKNFSIVVNNKKENGYIVGNIEKVSRNECSPFLMEGK